MLCYSVIKHVVDSGYRRTTEECKEHGSTAYAFETLLYCQITTALSNIDHILVFLSNYWFRITTNAVERELRESVTTSFSSSRKL